MTDGNRTPVNEIEFQYLTTAPDWGKNDVPQEYIKQLIEDKEILLSRINENGEIELVLDENKQPISASRQIEQWARLGFLVKDIRLGNIPRFIGGSDYIEYYLNLAGDVLEANLPRSHITSLQRSAVKLEVSQSVGGFFRKRSNTITSENFTNELDPNKKNFFGGKKSED